MSLNIASESLLQDLLAAQPSTNVMIEVPAFMACDAVNTQAIVTLHGNGNELLIKGRPLRELPRELQALRDGAAMPALGEGRVCETCEARGLCRRDDWKPLT